MTHPNGANTLLLAALVLVLAACAFLAAKIVLAARSAASPAPQPFALRPIANVCTAGSCPTIYETGSDRLVVQGFTLSAHQAGIDVPDGEALVEIPVELLKEALQKLS
ncbi:hypothetical protein [Actinoplanes sp. NBRC 101535]|uniref:hypothetical protein n=1 Tax=Actinoplanes sp. NBRC 101535 TaxID=3032196 RepID=UPI002554A1AC|nr:hypothetical protein [Actinoplanes sp. NBRC 101535]